MSCIASAVVNSNRHKLVSISEKKTNLDNWGLNFLVSGQSNNEWKASDKLSMKLRVFDLVKYTLMPRYSTASAANVTMK